LNGIGLSQSTSTYISGVNSKLHLKVTITDFAIINRTYHNETGISERMLVSTMASTHPLLLPIAQAFRPRTKVSDAYAEERRT
jgi:hypothetical protein